MADSGGASLGMRKVAAALVEEARQQPDPAVKLGALQRLRELALRRDPGLVPEVVSRLPELRAQPVSSVRNFLAEIIEEIGLKDTEQVPRMMPVLVALVQDETPAVARRAVAAGTILSKFMFEQLDSKSGQTADGSVSSKKYLQNIFSIVKKFKESICSFALQRQNIGVRMNALKFVETIILLYTSASLQSSITDSGSSRFSFADRNGYLQPNLDVAVFEDEAKTYLGLLLDLLCETNAVTLPTPVALVAIGSLAAIAKQRPSLCGRIIPTLLALGPKCEWLREAHVPSVSHALKTAYLQLLRVSYAEEGQLREQLIDVLRLMGAGDVARRVDRAVRKWQAPRDARVKGSGMVADGALKRKEHELMGDGNRKAKRSKNALQDRSLQKLENGANAGNTSEELSKSPGPLLDPDMPTNKQDGSSDLVMNNDQGFGDADDNSILDPTVTNTPEDSLSEEVVSGEQEKQNNECVTSDQHLQLGGNSNHQGIELKGDTIVGGYVAGNSSISPLEQLIGMIGALIVQGEKAATSIELLINSLSADMLADVVITNMQNLPAVAPDFAGEKVSPGQALSSAGVNFAIPQSEQSQCAYKEELTPQSEQCTLQQTTNLPNVS